MSFIRGQAGSLDDYQSVLSDYEFLSTEQTPDGHKRTIYPIGVSLLAVPFVAVKQMVNPSFQEFLKTRVPSRFEGQVACVYGALAAVCFLLIAFEICSDLRLSIIASLIFSFCTSMWSTATRALWQHGPLVLMYCLALLFFLRARRSERMAAYSALPLAFAYIIRPTASLAIGWLSLFVFFQYRRQFLLYGFLGVVVAIPWFLFNEHTYGTWLPPYYQAGQLMPGPNFWLALAGHWISPSRGLLIYSPVFIFSFYGMWLVVRGKDNRFLSACLMGLIMSHWLMVSIFRCWWGGHSFGPRLMSDMIPFLCFFLIIVLRDIRQSIHSKRSFVLVTFFIITVVLSAAVHSRGAMVWSVYEWNVSPTNIDQDIRRLWDWRDPQFLRGSIIGAS